MFELSVISPQDDKAVFDIIQQVGKEFGAIGDGFGPSDCEVNAMSQYYSVENKSCYFVVKQLNEIVGCGGVAMFQDQTDICELRKVFLLPKARGHGLGEKICIESLAFAKTQGYQQCYLDTLSSMTSAIGLYKKLGFKRLEQPHEKAIHSGCDVWMIKDL